jgi:uncharacterized protein YidB (DUF937 family)
LVIDFTGGAGVSFQLHEEVGMSGFGDGGAVPGGNVGKPLMIALLALLAARYFGGKGKEQPAEAPMPEPDAAQNASPGSILDGLGGLIDQFQKKGFGDAVDSWINTGKNKDVSSREVTAALGNDVVDELSRRTGLSRDQVVDELARILPRAVDRMTPQGRLPTRQEIERLMAD